LIQDKHQALLERIKTLENENAIQALQIRELRTNPEKLLEDEIQVEEMANPEATPEQDEPIETTDDEDEDFHGW
jgi:hypothetical protein